MIHPVYLYLFDSDSKLCTGFAMCPDLVYVCIWQIKDVFLSYFYTVFAAVGVKVHVCPVSAVQKEH